MPESSDSDSDHGNANSSHNANERTSLLRHDAIRRPRSSHHHGSRHASGNNPSSQSSSSRRRTDQASVNRYPSSMFDNTMLMNPGPSTSAPVVSELTSNLPSISEASGSQQRRSERSHKKRKSRAAATVQVVAADIAPLLAPANHSINCDSDYAEVGVDHPASEAIPSSRSVILDLTGRTAPPSTPTSALGDPSPPSYEYV